MLQPERGEIEWQIINSKAKLFIILSSSAYSGDQQFIDRPEREVEQREGGGGVGESC